MKVLVIAPHPDDETLGCGGTIARLAAEGHSVIVGVITGQGDAPHPLYKPEGFKVIRNELAAACKVLGVEHIELVNLPTVLIPDLPRYVLNRAVLELIEKVCPDKLFVPFPLDLHGDHRQVFHAASIAWRPYLTLGGKIREVYCYEVLSETHLNIPYVEQAFVPNVFYDVSNYIEKKIEAFACFVSQVQEAPLPRSLTSLRALAAYRGSQIGVSAAEAFVLVRMLQ